MDQLDPDAGISQARSRWLEVIPGVAPILLIAPHGGRAGAAAHATLHPKVNDLETAAITRALAARTGATAFINFGMDRNELDCNRLSQILAREPWLLSAIADHLERLATQHGRATVLLIHGWNIIEPRVDLGLGLREHNGRLRPPRGAHVSASDQFIRGPASELAARLRAAAILPTFGIRYPGGGAQNLLQAFTPRYLESTNLSLQRLAGLAAAGSIDALQLELSVALRLPGPARETMIDAIATTFGQSEDAPPEPSTLAISRVNPPAATKKAPSTSPVGPPLRVGIEFYDARLKLGGMASFDFGPGAAGGRIMMLFERRRVALFTGEGGALREGNRVSLGPLTLDIGARGGGLGFRGPAVVVDDGTAYLSVEHALAGGRLDPAMEINLNLEFQPGGSCFGDLFENLDTVLKRGLNDPDGHTELARAVPPHASFGALSGAVVLDGAARRLDAVARVGVSFVGLGPEKFVSRRMLWACWPAPCGYEAIELRALERETANPRGVVHLLRDGIWCQSELASVELETASPYSPPAKIAASLTLVDGSHSIEGEPDTFMTLSRPGADGARIHTSLGFAQYNIDGASAVGMYEYSRRVGQPDTNSDDPED